MALQLLAQDRVSWRQLLVSGVLVGAGIGAMHYAGMATMDMPVQLRYDPWVFALSIVVGMAWPERPFPLKRASWPWPTSSMR